MVSQTDNPPRKPKKGRGKSQTRRIAATMLAQILRGKTLDDVRDRLDDLAAPERNLADAIVQTALRHYGEIDQLMQRHMKRRLPLRPHIGHALLATGIAQLRFMDVLAHAALHETVAATGRREQPFRGLINAVLRAVAADETPTDPQLNAPEWMRQRWTQAYGEANCAAIMAAHLRLADLDICFKNPVKAAAWAKTQGGTLVSETHVRLHRPGAIPALPDYAEGDWFVQDVAAGWPARMLAAMLAHAEAPTRLLDLCAAPGGKTLQLAAAGHAVTALDISANRLKKMHANLQRTQLQAEMIEADITAWQPDDLFDGVLLDAPCSASGTLRRHPDLALHRREGYVDKLTAMQTELLQRAAGFVKPGGYLVYAVCSLDPAEGENLVSDFLATAPQLTLCTPQDVPSEFIRNGFLRCTPADWPQHGGMDGFFAAIMQKTSEKPAQ